MTIAAAQSTSEFSDFLPVYAMSSPGSDPYSPVVELSTRHQGTVTIFLMTAILSG